MKVLLLTLAFLVLSTNAEAQKEWRSKPVLCESDETKQQEFYKENNLYPMMVGVGAAIVGPNMEQVPVVTYVLYNQEENYMMVVEYQQSEVCILSIGAGVSFDVEQLEGFLGSK